MFQKFCRISRKNFTNILADKLESFNFRREKRHFRICNREAKKMFIEFTDVKKSLSIGTGNILDYQK